MAINRIYIVWVSSRSFRILLHKEKIRKKILRENPPINEKMICVMFLHTGRKPSEAQIKTNYLKQMQINK